MQNYSKIQKFISFLLIFSILFSFTINIKFFGFIGTIFASDTKYYNLVSIFVQEDIYRDIKSEVNTYAKNIQRTLENTKAIIIPTPKDESPFNIASVNEKLYFEGEKGIFGTKGNSKLIGTIFIGNLALPVVSNNGSFEKTVFPYVDFDDKLYIYDHEEKIYKINSNTFKDPKAEIWHGFISPNTGDLNEDIKQIKDYFSKNEDYYNGVGNFKNEEGITNGKQDEELIPEYEPAVFYYDQFRESKAVKYVDYKAYEAFLDNIEDITYNRFSKELAETIKEKYFGSQQKFIGDISKIIGTGSESQKALAVTQLTTNNTPDIQTRHIIENTTKKFLQIFNQATLGGFRKDVHNAGRYNSGSKVGVDLIPYLVSNLDGLSQSVIKNVNNDLEKYIDNLVKNGLSRDIAIPDNFIILSDKNLSSVTRDGVKIDPVLSTVTYTNFLYGTPGKNISSASGCTFYRGSTYNSGQLVEANRGFNVNLVNDDVRLSQGKTNGYWGGNSPVNLNPSSDGLDIWKLKSSDYKNAIKPLYDILGSLKTTDSSKNPKPQNCFDNNFLLTNIIGTNGEVIYNVPFDGGPAIGWTYDSTNSNYTYLFSFKIKHPVARGGFFNRHFEEVEYSHNIKYSYNSFNYPYDFDYTYANFPTLPVESCDRHILNLDGREIKSYSSNCSVSGGIAKIPVFKIYNFHKINSWIEHKSPNNDDLVKQTQYMISPNLPIDKDRYIDFIGADNSYAKINYPYLFRVVLDENEEFSLENAKKSLKKYLDEKSKEINSLIKSKSGVVSDLFKTGPYPSPNIDLYDLLKSKPDKEVEILGSKKTLSYIDTLIFSIYWNNLNSVGAKYKFIMENYLSDQFGGNNFNFFLPKSKKQYEISYLGAPGDARNMYIKLDPEDKAENPYSDIISNNLTSNNFLLGNIGSKGNNLENKGNNFKNKGNNLENSSGNFKCAPPEGVPIWKWIPAVKCWLKDMIPPKISFTEQSSGLSLISSDNNSGFFDNEDLNKNGINDYLEKELKNGSLKLKTDSIKYYYDSTGKLEANLLNSSGSNILFDNVSNISFELQKLEIPIDVNKPFDETNKKVIFDKTSVEKSILNNEDAYNEALKYVFFKDSRVVVKDGKAIYNFVTKSKDANITFKATVTLKDEKGNIVIQKEDSKTVQIRGDLFYATNYKLSKLNDELTIDFGLESVTASASSNIFLIESDNFNTLKSNLEDLDSLSNAKDKIFITLMNNDRSGNSLPINYPLNIRITDEKGNLLVEPYDITSLSSPKALLNFKETGTYKIEIKDKTGFVIKKEIEVLPDDAFEIVPSLSTTLIEKGGVITTNVFTIYDQFKNPTVGDNYQVEASISGDSLTFEDSTSKTIFNVIEGYKPFRLKSTSSSGNANITFKLKKAEKIIQEKTLSLSVVDKIDFEINGLPNEIKVGYNNYNFDLRILNNTENFKFNSRAYLVNNLYITSNEEYIDIKDNFGTGSFTTNTKAGEKVKLEFKIEGVKDSLFKEIDILPDLPVKVDLTLSKSKLEADKNSTSQLYVDLKDRYNNIVWNDNSTVLTLEILEKYRHIIKANNKEFVAKKGKATFILNATNIPGIAFFKVSTSPNLSNNKIEIVGQSPFKKEELDSISKMRSSGILTDIGRQFFEEYDLDNYRFKYNDRSILQSSKDFKALNSSQQDKILSLYDAKNKLIIPGVGENAGKIETFYFWNKDKINGKKYNSIYTTLLGSNYGDITIKDNLANSILFDKNNRALAITSLLNNLDKNIETLNINPNGNVVLNNSYSDLSQDISTNFNVSNGNLEISFLNNTFGKLVSNIYFNLKKVNLSNCENGDLKNCLKEDKNLIVVKPIDNNYKANINKVSGLSLVDNFGNKILDVTNDGKISKSIYTQFEISNNYNEGLVLDVKYNGKIVGNFAIKFSSGEINFIRDLNILESFKNLQDNGGMVVYLETRDYYYSKKYLGASTHDDNFSYIVSYNDPFASENGSLNNFSKNFTKGYESFITDNAIGWDGDNKTLLSFAAGKNVGDSTKDYMSFSLINVGDPLVSLKQIKKKLPDTTKDRKFDSSVGYLISKDTDNIAYSIFDYNNDDITDIVILKRDGYVELLEGTGDIKNFINRGNLVYIADFGSKPVIQTGDFTGDGYEDIVFLNKNRQPILLNNNKKDFTRINLNLHLNGIISQIISYDMDLDGKHDLVTLDDSGEININYGTSEAGTFEKKLVDSGLGINLSGEVRKDGGALYFAGLYQIPEDKTQDYIKESGEILNKEKSGSGNEENEFNEGLVDKLIFTQMNYSGYISTGNNKADMLNNLLDLSTLKTGGLDVDSSSIADFVTNSSEYNSGESENDSLNISKMSTFIKSEYAEYEGLTVEKKFKDNNGNPLKGGDKVKLDIKITNNSTKVINNIAYVDKIPDPFKLSDNGDFTLNIGGREINREDIMLKSSPSDYYSFLVDSYKDGNIEKAISLNPGESIYLGLMLDTNAFSYGYIEAGIFDESTDHGDIILKNKNENCGKPYKLYKSVAARSLEKGDKGGVCKNEFPDGTKENTVDSDGNGVPDYIDKLVDGGKTGTGIEDYAKDKLKEFNKDTDGDGLADREDLSPNMNNDEDFMNSLDQIAGDVDKMMAGIDTILDGLSCGFGGGGCISTPLNWAPLAPGNDPILFGMPIGDGLKIDEGLPIFSAINWMGAGPLCIPFIWPPAIQGTGCSPSKGAGGRLGTSSATNFIRIFVTPTLTGAAGVAVCFGGPARVFGQIIPKGIHPLVPFGNCIVAATPVGCKTDGSEGEIYNMGNGNIVKRSNNGNTTTNGNNNENIIINGNCSGDDNTGKTPYLGDIAKDYLNYKKTGVKNNSLKSSLKEAFSKVAKGRSRWELPSRPLLSISGGGDSDFDIDVDFSALKAGNYEDVVKIQMTRVNPFPDFVMGWVTRQVEEIANKLTDFPTLYVILPDFDPVFDSGWSNFIENIKKQFSQGEKKASEEQDKLQSQIEAKQNEGKNIDCEKDKIGCYLNKSEILKLEGKKNIGSNKIVSGVKAAYEFMSNLPMISIQPQKVNFNLPWIDQKSIDKALKDFELTKIQRTEELQRAKKAWDIDNYKSVGNNSSIDADGNRAKIIADTQRLINSIDKNIEILNDYKRLPEKIYKILKIKETRINQILSNLETISKITGGRIGDNGKRFKAWVELYVLIKAILKSWQLLVDVFNDYSAECKQCKNERGDLMYYLWKMISAVIPRIPVIQFPKWPDIYLDLHNIRAQLNIGIPEYEFNLRPIIIPPLPRLYLPDSPNVNINLPQLPLLPTIELMTELPDLPALPKIELPNLPPPPKLPKLLSSIEGFLDILKIITKVMCLLRTSPFVPEWRAGDQIAFISESGGYISSNFLDISLPQFSFPFVDAIKVTTYVNLEMDIDFLVEMSRQMALPLNIFTNDIVNMLNIGVGDLDFRDALPFTDVDVDIGGGGKGLPSNGGVIKIGDEGAFNINSSDKKVSIYKLANLIALNLLKLHGNIKKESNIALSNDKFKKTISKQLPNIKNEKIAGVWKDTLNYLFTKEDKLINNLLKNNEEKFNEAKSILNEEKDKNNKQINEINKYLLDGPSQNLLINSINENKFREYNTRLEKYNLQAVNSIKNLFKPDDEVEKIRTESKEVLNKLKTGLNDFSSKLQDSKTAFEKVKVNKKANDKITNLALNTLNNGINSTNNLSLNKDLLALNSAGKTYTPESEYGLPNCGNKKTNGYSYVYKGIYIVEEYLTKKISYLLFDYIDELGGKEKFNESDFDKDGDKDIIYMVGNEIFIKENLVNKKINKDYYTGSPLVLNSYDNIFYNNDFIEGVNGLIESISDNNYINLRFLDSTNPLISNYKIEFYNIVDKFDDLMNGFSSQYIPKNIKKYVIDGFRDIDEITKDTEDATFKIRKNLAYINAIGNLDGVTLKTKELKNLKDDINSNKEIIINAGTKVYSSSDKVTLTYYLFKDKDKELKLKNVSINSYSNIEFDEDIVLVGLVGDAYVELKSTLELSGNSIISYVKKPLIPGAKIEYAENEVSNGTTQYISIKYYDGSITDLDFSESVYYELYDLGNKSDDYLIRTSIKNDYYYVKAIAFKNNKFSTYSNQILLSPQKESDTKAPEISFLGIKVPVYQNKLIDISDYVFEDGGVKNIKEIYIDFNLELDSNNNGNTYDDKDYELGKTSSGMNIKIEGNKIFLDVGPFDKLYNKNVRITVIDSNNNVGYKDVPFIVYSPIPNISNVVDNKIDGKINEVLLNEPVNFYRIRGGSIDKIVDKDSLDTTQTFDEGKFNFNLGEESSAKNGLEVSYLGQTLFKIDEYTGKINISDFDKEKNKISFRVYSSNDKNNDLAYPKIIVLKDDIPIYYEYLTTPNTGKVELVDSFENLNKVGVYYKNLSSEYEPYRIPLGVNNNAGDLIIIDPKDKSQTPVFKIFKDARVFTLNEMYYLEYDNFDKYVVYNLKKVGSENIIGKVMIIPEKNFILK